MTVTFVAGETAHLRPGDPVWLDGVRGKVDRVHRDGTIRVSLAEAGLGPVDHVEPSRLSAEVQS